MSPLKKATCLGSMKVCVVCGREYSQWAPRQKTCTKKCSKERAKQYDKKYRKDKR